MLDHFDSIKESFLENLKFSQDADGNHESLQHPMVFLSQPLGFRASMLIMGAGSSVLIPGRMVSFR